MIFISWFLALHVIGVPVQTDAVFFRSDNLRGVAMRQLPGPYTIMDDEGGEEEIRALVDEDGIPYWFRRIKTAVCQTGECKLVDIGIYWDCAGDFFGLEVYGEHLTKTDHSTFQPDDYAKLIATLSNDWSILREYEFTELTEESHGSKVDAVSGATRKEIALEAVQDAVYTTYTLWHLVHLGEKEQLSALTVDRLRKGDVLNSLLKSDEKKYRYFLVELAAQSRVPFSAVLSQIIVDGIRDPRDPYLQNLCIKALGGAYNERESFQDGIAETYDASNGALRLRMLAGLRSMPRVYPRLSGVLLTDLKEENEWYVVRILPLLTRSTVYTDALIGRVRQLAGSEKEIVRNAALEFLERVGQKLKE